MRRLSLHLSVLVCLLLGGCASTTPPAGDRLLLVVSLDGFRWDYLDRYRAPTLQSLAAQGVRARSLRPSFPTKTFPNHYTLVTGLRPARHGIVGNWFYDPASGETFGMSKPVSNTQSRWWGGEPVWITAERQGVRSACYYWPGSEAPHGGLRPAFWRPFDDRTPSVERVDGLLAWLDRPAAERPRLALMYFSAVDTAGHKLGPDSPDLQAAITEVDDALARLLAGLDRLGLRARTDLVVVSDHGMSPISAERVIFFEDLMDLSKVEIEVSGTYGGVRPKPGAGTAAELAAAIRAKAPPQLQVYRRDEIPARFAFSGNDRIPAVLLLPDDQWCLERKTGWPARRANYDKGSHGWDNATPNMGALFIASGPSFRRGMVLPAAENIDVYNLLCATLGVQPAPNDGGDALVRAVLRR